MEFRRSLDPLAPYKPPRMSQEAAAERGTDGYVKLTSNELSFGPLPEAEAALAEALPRANRYPDRHASSCARLSPQPTPAPTPGRTCSWATGPARCSSTSSSSSSVRAR